MVSNAKKVLYVIPAMNSGGAQRLLVDICHELNIRGGYEIAIAILTDESNRYENELSGIEVKRFSIPRHVSILSWRRPHLSALQQYVHAFAPDIIHTHIYFSDLIINQINYTGAKFFSHIHGPTSQYDTHLFASWPFKKQMIAYAERWLMMRAYKKRNTKFLAVSEQYTTYAKSILPELANNVHLLHNGIKLNTDSVCSGHTANDLLRLVTVGRLEKVKGFELAIEVAERLNNSGTFFVLDIYGEGEQRAMLQTVINEKGLQQKVFLRGFNANIKKEYSKYHLYLHTAFKEPFGLTLVEAMAAGLPVVCIDGGGNRDIVSDGHNGFILKERNANTLAEKIFLLSENKSLYEQMSKAAKATAQQFTIERCVDKLVRFYES